MKGTTMIDQESNGRKGFSGLSVFLWFAGGALTGAAAAYLAQAQNRERVLDLARRTRVKAGRVPHALKEASSAAREAFVGSYGRNSEAVEAVEVVKPKAG
jgi:hypothetical protein